MTNGLMEKIMKRFSVKVKWVDTSCSDNILQNITNKTKMIFIETPTNPMMTMSDIEEISKITQENKIILTVDNTFMSPFFQRPLELGADIVVHSTTKYLGGHSDIIGGVVIITTIAIHSILSLRKPSLSK